MQENFKHTNFASTVDECEFELLDNKFANSMTNLTLSMQIVLTTRFGFEVQLQMCHKSNGNESDKKISANTILSGGSKS